MKEVKRVIMDFKLDKSHLLQQELFRRFAETEIKPLAKEMDEKEAYDLDLLAKTLKDWRFEIIGFVGSERCVITAGGISTDEVMPKTMESRLKPGLYLCGEVLDMDCDTGGYNLQCAFSTGYIAGESAAKSLSDAPGQ